MVAMREWLSVISFAIERRAVPQRNAWIHKDESNVYHIIYRTHTLSYEFDVRWTQGEHSRSVDWSVQLGSAANPRVKLTTLAPSCQPMPCPMQHSVVRVMRLNWLHSANPRVSPALVRLHFDASVTAVDVV